MGKKYGVIYADPPWTYEDAQKARGGASGHYKLLTIEDLKALRVGDVAADDCVLLMWATYPLMAEALALIAAWGFTYRTIAFQWVKTYGSGKTFLGMGRWTRSNTEPCLLAVRGKPKRRAEATGISQVIISPVSRHSEKPEAVREAIERLVETRGGGRLEVFARTRARGWDATGFDCDGRDIRDWLAAAVK